MSCRPDLSIVAAALATLCLSGNPARAEDCGPDKLGTSRIVQVGVEGGLEVGLKSYPRTIPLADHEVILTFDDGPAPGTTPQILDALADQCVRATFFDIGRDAENLPQVARREAQEGHTVAYHTYSHPQPTMRMMSRAAAREDVLRGMIAVEKAAYGQDFNEGEPKDLKDLKLHAPFFRFPGFAATDDLRRWFAANNVGIFGVDLWASDWIEMTPEEELKLVMSRLDSLGKGMLILHDNRQWTATMLPMLMRELKAKGYRIVHMVPGPGTGPTEPAPKKRSSEEGRTPGVARPPFDKSAAKVRDAPRPAQPARTE